MENFIKTTALTKICSLDKRIRFINGGTSSSKTISILMYLIDYCQSHDGKIASVVSETMPHLRKGAMRDFINIMRSQNYFKDARWNKTDSTYTFETLTKLEFFSADQPGKVRGPRRDVLFMNEANNIQYEIFTQLEIRTKELIILDSNPTNEYWAYTELKDKRDDVDFLTLTYKDNEGLDSRIVDSIEKRKGNRNWWLVYGLGQLGEVEGKIYKDWLIVDKVPHEARLIRYGMDFGYSNDPAAIIGVYKYNEGFILDEICYQKGLSNKQLSDIFLNQDKALIIADSAEPKSIDEIKSYGMMIVPSNKGKDSVNHGIQYVQNQRISMTKRSLNVIREYRNYMWKTDKEGKMMDVPDGLYDHTMDAIRYAIANDINKVGWTPRDPGGVKPYFDTLPA